MSASDGYQTIAHLAGLGALIDAAAGSKRRQDLKVDTPYIAAATPLETQLTDIWKEILDVDQVGAEDDFFALRGDSLACMRVLLRIIEVWHVELSIETFFAQPTVRQLAAAVAVACRTDDGGTDRPLELEVQIGRDSPDSE